MMTPFWMPADLVCLADEIEHFKCLLPPFEVSPPALLKHFLLDVLHYFEILKARFDEILGFARYLVVGKLETNNT